MENEKVYNTHIRQNVIDFFLYFYRLDRFKV